MQRACIDMVKRVCKNCKHPILRFEGSKGYFHCSYLGEEYMEIVISQKCGYEVPDCTCDNPEAIMRDKHP